MRKREWLGGRSLFDFMHILSRLVQYCDRDSFSCPKAGNDCPYSRNFFPWCHPFFSPFPVFHPLIFSFRRRFAFGMLKFVYARQRAPRRLNKRPISSLGHLVGRASKTFCRKTCENEKMCLLLQPQTSTAATCRVIAAQRWRDSSAG